MTDFSFDYVYECFLNSPSNKEHIYCFIDQTPLGKSLCDITLSYSYSKRDGLPISPKTIATNAWIYDYAKIITAIFFRFPPEMIGKSLYKDYIEDRLSYVAVEKNVLKNELLYLNSKYLYKPRLAYWLIEAMSLAIAHHRPNSGWNIDNKELLECFQSFMRSKALSMRLEETLECKEYACRPIQKL